MAKAGRQWRLLALIATVAAGLALEHARSGDPEPPVDPEPPGDPAVPGVPRSTVPAGSGGIGEAGIASCQGEPAGRASPGRASPGSTTFTSPAYQRICARRPAMRRPPRRRARLGTVFAAWALLGVGLALATNVALFYLHYKGGGSRLLAAEQRLVAAQPVMPSRHGFSGACAPPSGPDGSLQGELLIPSLRLRAPVVQGDGSAQLAVAVGHVVSSVWPGSVGTAVLAAHNVSWFSRIDMLRAGSTIRYRTPCATYTYAVTSQRVVDAGSAVASGNAPVLVLDTCYPLDALWFTSRRYLVTATLQRSTPRAVSAAPGSSPQVSGDGSATTPSLPSRPADLPSVPLGTLRLSGSPTDSFRQSLAPVHAELSLVQLFQRSLASDLSGPGAPFAAASVQTYLRGLSIDLRVAGTQVQSARATAVVQLSGGAAPGAYRLRFTAVRGITGWSSPELSSTPWGA